MTNLREYLLLTGAFLLLSTPAAQAQLAPVPKKAPRTPVSKQVLSGKAAPLAPATLLHGTASVIDTERLRIDGTEIRLFGVVPPLMGASFGPQARAVLDSLAQGSTVTCQIKDRTRDGHYLAQCNNAAQADFGLELLRRGLAASARGSLNGTVYAAPYQAAEAAAQNQKLGIWSTSMPSAASESSIRSVMTKAEAAKAEAEKAKKEAEAAKQEVERAKAELAKLEAQRPAPLAAPLEVDQVSTVMNLGSGTNADKASPVTKTVAAPSIAPTPTPDEIQALLMAEKPAIPEALPAPRTLLERYQIFFAGLLVFGTTLILSIAFVWNKFRQKKEDMRSIAAALHGELMAARSVCQARLAKIRQEGNDYNTTWPRIRVMVFQAYLGKLGCLGAELSRQIASIYGMASDYASYYNTAEPRNEGKTKRQALELLIKHIEEVTPRLSSIEKEGKLPVKETKSTVARPALKAPMQKPLFLSLTPQPTPPSGKPSSQKDTPQEDQQFNEEKIVRTVELKASLTEAKTEIVSETTAPQKAAPKATIKGTATKAKTSPVIIKKAVTAATKAQVKRTTQGVEQAAQAAIKAVAGLNLKAPIIERLEKIKTFTKDRTTTAKTTKPESYDDFSIPDYANLTEEELEALLYAEEEMIMASPVGKWKQAG